MRDFQKVLLGRVRGRAVAGILCCWGMWMVLAFTGCDQAGTPREVQTAHMEPTVRKGDTISVHPVGAEPFRRGELAVLEVPHPAGDTTRFQTVYRIFALPGDVLSATDQGVISVNGQPADWMPHPVSEPPVSPSLPEPIPFPYTVPEDHVFVTGDNTADSWDSRYYGALSQDRVVGRVQEPRP